MLAELSPWHWFILALALMIFEIFAPGAFFLWLGIAAGAVGVLLALMPQMSWQLQLTAFAVLSVLSVLAWLRYKRNRPDASDQPTLNRRGLQYIGREFTLEHPIVNGVGKVRVDDSTWRVAGPDLPAGTQVKVTEVDGVVFFVEQSAPRLDQQQGV